MKKISIFLYFILFLISNTSGQNKTEKLLLGGSGWNKIVIIDKEIEANRVGTSPTRRMGVQFSSRYTGRQHLVLLRQGCQNDQPQPSGNMEYHRTGRM